MILLKFPIFAEKNDVVEIKFIFFDLHINCLKIQQNSHPSPFFWRGAGVRSDL